MAEAQARAEAEPFEFHVPLDEGTDEADAVETDEADTPEAAAAKPEQTEDATEELLSAEEAGVDENDPAYQALRKKFIAAYQKKLDAERKKAKPAETPAEQVKAPVEAKPAGTSEDDPFEAVYAVDLDSVKPTLTFREGSDLADYADELTDVVGQAVKQYVKAALDGVKNNDRQFRERMTQAERESSARDVIAKYAQEISDHPEYEDKAPELAKFAEKTRALEIEDPETWVQIVEKKFGLERGWRGEVEAKQQQAGRENIRLATKPRAVVSRPSRPTATATPGDFEGALSAAMRKHGL
jgi:hypothetical protein